MKINQTILCFVFFVIGLSLLHSSCTINKTVSESNLQNFNPDDQDLILRRTTLVVRDITKSLAFYEGALEMDIIYDNLIKRPHKTEDREEIIRLVFLKSVHEYIGVLGLLEYDYGYDVKSIKPIRREGFTAGNIVLLFNTKDVKTGFERLRKVDGVEVVTEPNLREYPSYDGESKIRVMMSTVYDPDGFLVEYNQLLDEIK